MNDNENDLSGFNRRDFLRGGSVAAMMTLLGGVPLVAQEQPKPATDDAGGLKVKCAVIGTGAWGRELITTVQRVPQANLATICDSYKASLTRAARLAPNAKTTEDYKTILDDKEITAVFVATPTHLHKDIVLAALKAGKHVYCEAPLAHTLEDTREIAKAAKDAFKQVFQPGLQNRSDPQRHFMLPFIRSGALGKWVKVRTQWHNKNVSWRFTASTPEREKAINWRLDSTISPGLLGEISIHQIDQVAWFLNDLPKSVAGFGSIANWDDGRDVADTAQAVIQFSAKVPLTCEVTLANSFDSDYEVYYGSYAAVMIRESKAWMFKEVDAPSIGWEVYAKKEQFFKETGISLKMGASVALPQDQPQSEEALITSTPFFLALQAFLGNAAVVPAAVEDFSEAFDASDRAALEKHLAGLSLRKAANWKDGLIATVIALKANEAVVKGEKVAFQKEWFEV